MTDVGFALTVALLAIGGAAVASIPTVRLRFEERALAAVVLAILLGTAVVYLFMLVAGVSPASVIGGTAIFTAASLLLVMPRRGAAVARWRQELDELLDPARRRHLAGLVAILVAASVIFGIVFSHTLFADSSGNLDSTYATVWADWAQHLTTASSFAVAHNVPPQNPLFSGHGLDYPFLPDFHSATLEILGASPPVALALPGALLITCITLLVATLAARLGAGLSVGALAAVMLFIGGGLGVTGVLADACHAHGFTATQCTWSGLASHPLDIPAVVGGTLKELPGVIAAQPRAYDGLETAASQMALPNQQWYTPLFAWWLPQRSLLYGFAGALVVLTLVLAALRAEGRHLETWALAAVPLGLMPLIHIHTLFATVAILAVFAVTARRAGWLVLGAMTALVAAPRLLTLVQASHGTVVSGNVFPTVEPGWMYLGGGVTQGNQVCTSVGCTRPPLNPVNLAVATAGYVRAIFSPEYWGFWIANTAVVLPVGVVVAGAALYARLDGARAALARRITGAVPADLLRFAVGGLLLFAIANVVVFQSWDWDNTKLFVYWYLSGVLLLSAVVVHLWRRWWRGVAAVALSASVLLTGVVVLLRFLPWTPAADAIGGPYPIVTADDIAIGRTVAAQTSPGSAFLTEGKPNDPLTTVAGRTVLMGYYGWLWSYGTDFGTRQADERTMLEGCRDGITSSDCAVAGLLREYRVAYVEIDNRLDAAGVIDSSTNVSWWASQSLPVVAQNSSVTVYDVRGL